MPPAIHTVIIECVDGEFSYYVISPRKKIRNTLWVYHGDSILWKCAQRSLIFALDFGWNSPFPERRYHVAAGEEKTLTVPFEVWPGRYQYIIALHDGTRIWIDNPQFIIRG